MPFIEVKSVLQSPNQDSLGQLSSEVGSLLGIPSTSRMRIFWHHLENSSSFGMGENVQSADLSQFVLFYTRSDYPREKLTQAMKHLYQRVAQLTKAPENSVVVCHISIQAGHIVSSNGIWEGGSTYRPF